LVQVGVGGVGDEHAYRTGEDVGQLDGLAAELGQTVGGQRRIDRQRACANASVAVSMSFSPSYPDSSQTISRTLDVYPRKGTIACAFLPIGLPKRIGVARQTPDGGTCAAGAPC
jgi:hypothetical protein